MSEVVESCMVVPSEKTPQHDLWLSNLDIMSARHGYTPVIYFYESSSTSDPSFSPVDVVKNALAKALVPYYSLAGRLVKGADGRLKIHCNAAGVLFVVAKSEVTLKSLNESEPSLEMKDMFLPSMVGSALQHPCVLQMIQMTFLKCGGMAIGMARHHAFNDGRGVFHLMLQTWVNLARGRTDADLPAPPVLDRTILRARSPPTPQFDHREYFLKSNISSQTPHVTDSISCSMKLSQDQIKMLKYSGKPDPTVAMTTFSVVAAHIWKCVCEARGLSPETDAQLISVVDIRNHLRPPLSQQYLGNAIICTSIVAKVHDVLLESAAGLAPKIKGALDRVDDSYIRSAIDYMEFMDGDGTSLLADDNKSASQLRVISWLGMPIMEADFGWGPPKFMIRPPTGSYGVAYVKNDDAGISVIITLEAETMPRFKDLFYDKLSFSSKKRLSSSL